MDSRDLTHDELEAGVVQQLAVQRLRAGPGFRPIHAFAAWAGDFHTNRGLLLSQRQEEQQQKQRHQNPHGGENSSGDGTGVRRGGEEANDRSDNGGGGGEDINHHHHHHHHLHHLLLQQQPRGVDDSGPPMSPVGGGTIGAGTAGGDLNSSSSSSSSSNHNPNDAASLNVLSAASPHPARGSGVGRVDGEHEKGGSQEEGEEKLESSGQDAAAAARGAGSSGTRFSGNPNDDSGGGGASYDEGTFGRDQTIAMESLSANGLSDDLREQQTLEVYSKGAISHQSNAAPTVNVAELAAAMAEEIDALDGGGGGLEMAADAIKAKQMQERREQQQRNRQHVDGKRSDGARGIDGGVHGAERSSGHSGGDEGGKNDHEGTVGSRTIELEDHHLHMHLKEQELSSFPPARDVHYVLNVAGVVEAVYDHVGNAETRAAEAGAAHSRGTMESLLVPRRAFMAGLEALGLRLAPQDMRRLAVSSVPQTKPLTLLNRFGLMQSIREKQEPAVIARAVLVLTPTSSLAFSFTRTHA